MCNCVRNIGMLSLLGDDYGNALLFPMFDHSYDIYLFEGKLYSFYLTGHVGEDAKGKPLAIYNNLDPHELPLVTRKGTPIIEGQVEYNGKYVYKIMANPFRVVLVGVPIEKRSLLWS